jgi:pimeloyl-ACP methyl ester carboxylesterase
MQIASSQTTIIDDCAIHWEERGSGEPLLLLHGFTGTGQDWNHVLDLASMRLTTAFIAPDARGHGRSTNPSGDFTFRRCAHDVLDLLDRLGIARVRAVGMSLGAKTLLHVATMAPARVSRMILVSATPRFPEATRAAFRASAGAERGKEEWDLLRARHLHGDPQIAALLRLPAAFAEGPRDMDFDAERLAGISAATLLVAGDRDPLYPVELAVELYRGIPKAMLCVVPGGGHGPIFGHEREDFVRRALPFLRGA